MINYKSTFYLGVFVFLIPFLGFPTMWKMGLVVFAGLLLMFTSIRIPIPRKVFKNNNQNQNKKEKTEAIIVPGNSLPEVIPAKTERPEVAIKENNNIPPIITINPVSKNITPKKTTTRVAKKVDSVRKAKIKEL